GPLSLLKQIRKFGQFLFARIGDETVAQSVRFAVDDGIAATVCNCRFSTAGVPRRPDEHIDEMFVAPIDERGDGSAVQIIQSPADEWKAFRSEILHVRREVEFPVEPRLDGVLIARGNVSEMLRHE